MKTNLKALLATIATFVVLFAVILFAITFPNVAFPVLSVFGFSVMAISLFNGFKTIFKK
jgi:hypothetical protein